MQLANSIQNKITIDNTNFEDLIYYFRELELTDFQKFVRDLKDGTLELYYVQDV